jgi:NitT/TauT family transport system substrate-binding protein
LTWVLALFLFLSGCQKKQKQTVTKIVAAHAVGLCNMPLFITAEKQTAKEFGAEVELVNIPNWGDHPAALKSAKVDASVTPFTNVITAYANGLPIRIIAGSGLNGLYLLGQKSLNTIEKLKGKKIGTFRSDTLELTAYDVLRKAGFTQADFEMVYFTDGFSIMAAFADKRIDAMTHVEPFATQAVNKYGAEIIAKGQDVWGGSHPDCVLTTSEDALKNKRQALKALIAGMLKAEEFIEKEYGQAVDLCVGKYYTMDKADVLVAGQSQPPGIDIRDKKQFILDRSKSLMELGYISQPVGEKLIDFSLLGEVIAEHPELLAAVKVHANVTE